MKLVTPRESLLKPLAAVIGVVERRQTLPVLANVLMQARDGQLTLTATDLEVELVAQAGLPADDGEITLPARKLHDILKSLPDEAEVTLAVDGERALLKSGRSRFQLATLPAHDFPNTEDIPFEAELPIAQGALKRLIERTQFAMAQQDVRFYLNGLLLDWTGSELRAVATDGHRLALCTLAVEGVSAAPLQVILPRKGVQELGRLLGDGETPAVLRIGTNHAQVVLGDIRFTTKLIDGKFPDYERVLPRVGSRAILADRLVLRTALTRAAILSNEKFRGVRLQAGDWLLKVQAHNPEQEEAEEEVEVNYSGEAFEIGFNVAYLLDALGALPGELVKLAFTDSSSSCLIQDPESDSARYVIMPMRL